MTLPVLVLDINGTLADVRRTKVPGREPDGRTKRRYIYQRPGLEAFMQFAFQHFHVVIWTSAIAKNARMIVDSALGSLLRNQPYTLLSREHCYLPRNITGWPSVKSYHQITARFKDHPAYVIDDTDSKIQDFPASRQYVIPSFDACEEYTAGGDTPDDALCAAREWLCKQCAIECRPRH